MFEAIGNFFKWLFNLPRRIIEAMSVPGCVGCLTFLVLLIAVIVVYVIVATSEYKVPWRHSMTLERSIMIWALVFIIPWVLYRALWLWLEGDVSPFPDVDFAWNAGLREMEEAGINVREVPMFLVLGSASEDRDKSLIASAELQLRVKGSPQGPAALHWYANPEGVYIVVTETGCLSALTLQAERPRSDGKKGSEREAAPDLGGEAPMSPTGLGGGALAGPGPKLPPKPQGRGTLILPRGEEGGGGLAASIRRTPGPDDERAPPARSGTLVLRPDEMSALGGPVPSIRQSGMGRTTGGPATSTVALDIEEEGLEFQTDDAFRNTDIGLTSAQAGEQTRRLEYVCYLIKKLRKPLIPLNGILTLVPLSVMRLGQREGVEVQRAIKTDLSTVRRMLQVRCPVTALVVGMENEPGFRELVRRVGHDRATQQRFGKGFELWALPTAKTVEALTAHACAAFESWIYALFRERGSLSKPGNTKLYRLLCQVRRTLLPRLQAVLVGAFSSENEKEDPLLFSGCYFSAVGDRSDRQAFVRAVFDKLLEEQEDIEWARSALRADQRFRRLGTVVVFINILLIITLLASPFIRW